LPAAEQPAVSAEVLALVGSVRGEEAHRRKLQAGWADFEKNEKERARLVRSQLASLQVEVVAALADCWDEPLRTPLLTEGLEGGPE
jgi:hypothetical protein